MTRRLDCKGEGCEECQMCRYLNFLEWAGQVAGNVPSTIQRNPKLDAILAASLTAQAMSAGTAKTEGLGGDSPASPVRQDAPEPSTQTHTTKKKGE